MDSAVRDAESDIILGAQRMEDKRKEGALTTVSGYNKQYDSGVTHLYEPGDAADDDDFLEKVFYHYYTFEKDANGLSTGKEILTKDWAHTAAVDIVQRWGRMNVADANAYLDEHLEPVWGTRTC